jgi:hypothetical protein
VPRGDREAKRSCSNETDNRIENKMFSSFNLGLLAALGLAANSVSAAICEVPGGTADDGPAIKAALATCNNGGTVLLDKTYTIGSVLQTTDLNNVAIELTGTITLSPRKSKPIHN